MKVELQMPDPSVDWRALAFMIERNDDLRDDVTVVVEPDRLRFLDRAHHEIPTGIPPGKWTNGSIADIDVTLSFLDWVEEHFSQQAS